MPTGPGPRRDEAAAMRATARAIFQHALAECSIRKTFERNINNSRGVLRIADDLYDLGSYAQVFVVSIGKAAHTMAEALVGEVPAGLSGIVAGVQQPTAQAAGFRYFCGGHPVPNQESVRAGEAILKSLEKRTENSLVIFMVSGGGSSLAEKPMDDEITLADLTATYRELVLSGAPIAQINAVRKHLSAIKGGRLARAAAPAQQVSIMISDVPENALDSLASGPTMPDSSTVDDCYTIVNNYGLLDRFPKSVRDLFARNLLEETPKQGDPAFDRSRWWPILSNVTAQNEGAAQAQSAGFAVEVDNSCDDWDYARAADHLLDRLRQLRQREQRACIVSGGKSRCAWKNPAASADAISSSRFTVRTKSTKKIFVF